ncbi:hypothetical protein TVAG_070540 [Trichomonas vaginalis G3]|uniref:Uncharacterized protein n=1 Tax=Trichomonas vaginalis (strain ATCC PRA-98 / G3) TaxID=412133 RepID=A2D7V8_TRIV3|nr:armadillo (ARM) repeat-containing protein family [Trichomonas vaginalis G3]EAY23391.1 hypothetical protein TVAG_070540 [Trichomonas vaginalis G3]KAI5493805.1 armadillo (ARM) repeat-containing protein family [Trichomonas vaginalis G3]|eukprot:XP_001584377.1 hypothetical protein [Trichomonas vaginalis G3]
MPNISNLSNDSIISFFGIISILTSPNSPVQELFTTEEILNFLISNLQNSIKKVKIHIITSISQIVSSNHDIIQLLLPTQYYTNITSYLQLTSFKLQLISCYSLISSIGYSHDLYSLGINKIIETFQNQNQNNKNLIIKCITTAFHYFPEIISDFIENEIISTFIQFLAPIDPKSELQESIVMLFTEFITNIPEENLNFLNSIIPQTKILFDAYYSIYSQKEANASVSNATIKLLDLFIYYYHYHADLLSAHILSSDFINEVISIMQVESFRLSSKCLFFIFIAFESGKEDLVDAVIGVDISEQILSIMKEQSADDINFYLKIIINFIDTHQNGSESIQNYFGMDQLESILSDFTDSQNQQLAEIIFEKIA